MVGNLRPGPEEDASQSQGIVANRPASIGGEHSPFLLVVRRKEASEIGLRCRNTTASQGTRSSHYEEARRQHATLVGGFLGSPAQQSGIRTVLARFPRIVTHPRSPSTPAAGSWPAVGISHVSPSWAGATLSTNYRSAPAMCASAVNSDAQTAGDHSIYSACLDTVQTAVIENPEPLLARVPSMTSVLPCIMTVPVMSEVAPDVTSGWKVSLSPTRVKAMI